jgi:homoserine dehydrogenase
MPTASAVVADMIDMVVGRAPITFRNLELWSNREAALRPIDQAKSSAKYYLRFMAADRPGVLAEIAGVLGEHGISIASVIQHDDKRTEQGFVPLVIMTHTAVEGSVQAAVEKIDRQPIASPFSVKLRVHE